MNEFVMIEKEEIREIISKIYNIRKLTKDEIILKTVDTMTMLDNIEKYIKELKSMEYKNKSYDSFKEICDKGYYTEFSEKGNVFLNNVRTKMRVKLNNKYMPNLLVGILVNDNKSDKSELFTYLQEKSEQDILLELNNIINEKKCECLHYYINTDYDETKPYCWAFTHVEQGGLVPDYETCEEIKDCPTKRIMYQIKKEND